MTLTALALAVFAAAMLTWHRHERHAQATLTPVYMRPANGNGEWVHIGHVAAGPTGPPDWETDADIIAAHIAATSRYTTADWLPAVRACWAAGLTPHDTIALCRNVPGPHLVGQLLTAVNAART